MGAIQTEWRVLLMFNQVYVIAKIPLTNTPIDDIMYESVMEKIVTNISHASNIGESKLANAFPNEVHEIIDSIINETCTIMHFGVIFKDYTKACEFANFLRQQG